MAKVIDSAAKMAKDIYSNILSNIEKFLMSNKEFLAGMGIGAAFSTPAGKALLGRLKVDFVKAKAAAAAAGKKAAKDAWNYAITSKLGKTNLFENSLNETTKTGKVTAGVGRVGAAVAAGKILGYEIGGIVNEKNPVIKALKIAWPQIFSIGDVINGIRGDISDAEAKSKQAKAQKQASKVALQEALHQVENFDLKQYYDEEAKKMGMVDRPSHPQAENEWQKEVERNMSKRTTRGGGSNTNSPDWYFKGLANKMLGTNLTWAGVKDYDQDNAFVSCAAIHVNYLIPTKGNQLHEQIKANTNIEYQALRGKNTGAFNYTEEHVYMYDVAMSSMIALAEFIKKLIAISNTYDVQVTKLPQCLYASFYNAIVNTPGPSTNTGEAVYSDVIKNKPLYVTRLNSLVKDLNSYAYKWRTLNDRWNYISKKCLRDYSGSKAIYAIYVPKHMPILHATDGLKYVSLANKTITQLLDLLESELDAMRTYTTAQYSHPLIKVAGDMIKLLGAKSQTFSNCGYMVGTEVLSFAEDKEAADQIRNAKPLFIRDAYLPSYDGVTPGLQACELKDLTGGATTNWNDLNIIADEWLMTSDREKEFDAKDNLQMIQFVYNCEMSAGSGTNSRLITLTEHGSTELDHMSIVVYDATNSPEVWNISGIVSIYTSNQNKGIEYVGGLQTFIGTSANRFNDWIQWFTQIDFMPRIQFCVELGTTSGFIIDYLDIDNYAYIDSKQYSQMNNVCVYSQTFTFTPDQVNIVGLLTSA